jgi:hypothetical protein
MLEFSSSICIACSHSKFLEIKIVRAALNWIKILKLKLLFNIIPVSNALETWVCIDATVACISHLHTVKWEIKHSWVIFWSHNLFYNGPLMDKFSLPPW